jgi:hypothetical protein
MTRRWLLTGSLYLSGACTAASDPSATSSRLDVELRLDEEGAEDVELKTLGVRLDELILEGTGPDGPVSLSGVTDDEATLVEPTDPVAMGWLSLQPGHYDDVSIRCVLREAGATHALWASGTFEHDDRLFGFDLEVRPTLTFTTSVDLSLAAGEAARLVLSLEPDAWFDDLDVEQLGTGVVLWLEPQSGAAYDLVVEQIVRTTRAELDDASEDY